MTVSRLTVKPLPHLHVAYSGLPWHLHSFSTSASHPQLHLLKTIAALVLCLLHTQPPVVSLAL